MTKKKVAYLFLSYGDVNQAGLWERYFHGHEDSTVIAVHTADRFETRTPFMKANLIPYWVSTGWGTLGLVIAQIELIRYALRDPHVERLCLCSGSCVPIKTYQTTYDMLFEHDMSWIGLYKQYQSRMAKVTHLDFSSFRKHSQWVMLTRKHASMLVRFNYLSDFARCIIPDEHYVGSVLVHLGEEGNILHREQTVVNWHRISPVQMSPIEYNQISDENIQQWRFAHSIFARKFKPESNIADKWNDIVSGIELSDAVMEAPVPPVSEDNENIASSER